MSSDMSPPSIAVEVIDANAESALREALRVAEGATVQAALQLSSLARARELLVAAQNLDHIADSFIGIWGRRVRLNTPLSNGDRIELYRELIADAKSARLKRASEQGYRWQGRTRRVANTNNA